MKISFLTVLLVIIAFQNCSASATTAEVIPEWRIFREIHTPIPCTIINIDTSIDPFSKPMSDWRSVHVERVSGTYMGYELSKLITFYNFGGKIFRFDQSDKPEFNETVTGLIHNGGTTVNGVFLPSLAVGEKGEMQWYGPLRIGKSVFTKTSGTGSDDIRTVSSYIYILREKVSIDTDKPDSLRVASIVEGATSTETIEISSKIYKWHYGARLLDTEPFIKDVIF